MGTWQPGFDSTGMPVSRSGYIVTCKRDSDCRSRCRYHPGTGEPYVCAKRYQLYDYVYTDEDATPSFRQLDNAASFDPDPSETAVSGEYGVCVDAQYAFMQQCPYSVASQVVHGVTGCTDRWWSLLFCGIDVERVGPDFTTASVDFLGDLFAYFPNGRLLQPAMPDIDGDGLAETGEIRCYDPLDCTNKRVQLFRTLTSLSYAFLPPTGVGSWSARLAEALGFPRLAPCATLRVRTTSPTRSSV